MKMRKSLASQTLLEIQQKYLQIDKETYNIFRGKKFYQYLYRYRFTLVIIFH